MKQTASTLLTKNNTLAVRLGLLLALVFGVTHTQTTLAQGEHFNKKEKYQFYKWVDEHGNVHYSQTPPKDKTAKELMTIKASGAAPSDAGKAQEALQQRRKQLMESAESRNKPPKEETAATSEAAQKAKEEGCNTAKANLAQLKKEGRIRIQNEQGEYEYLDDTARQGQIDLNSKYLTEHCQ